MSGYPTDFGEWNKVTGEWTVKMTSTVGVLMSITPRNRVSLKTYPLEDIDEMRDLILQTKGNTTLYVNEEQDSIEKLTKTREQLS